jgi:hypothetical protein
VDGLYRAYCSDERTLMSARNPKSRSRPSQHSFPARIHRKRTHKHRHPAPSPYRKRREWEATPFRLRGLKVGMGLIINGFDTVALVYQFPDTPNILLIRAYERGSSSPSILKLNIVHVARAVHSMKRHEKWEDKDRRLNLVRMLRMLRYQRCTMMNSDVPRDASSLWFDTRNAEDIPLLKLKPLKFWRDSIFHQPDPAVACVPKTWFNREKTHLQRLSSALGGSLSTRGVRTFRPRCKPRREVGMEGLRLFSGAAKVAGMWSLWSIWWSGSRGEGNEVFIHVYVGDEIVTPGGCNAACSNHRIAFTFEDLRACFLGTTVVDQALKVADAQVRCLLWRPWLCMQHQVIRSVAIADNGRC